MIYRTASETALSFDLQSPWAYQRRAAQDATSRCVASEAGWGGASAHVRRLCGISGLTSFTCGIGAVQAVNSIPQNGSHNTVFFIACSFYLS